MSLAAVQQAIVEDRTARAHRTRAHRLDTTALVPGTSEVEFYREVQGDVGWRGPALLLRLDPDEGIAIIQYQGRPYLVGNQTHSSSRPNLPQQQRWFEVE